MNTIHDSSAPSCPTIILKKGKVELQIKNAASIIKKIDEMYPNNSYTGWNCYDLNKLKRQMSDEERAKQIKWMSSAKNWFRQELFGSLDEFDVIVTEPKQSEPEQITPTNIEDSIKNCFKPMPIEEKYSSPLPVRDFTPVAPPATNKNAYEIRLEVLKEATAFVKWHNEVSPKTEVSPTSSDDILYIAQKFYKFVENKR